jgi:uncharacterized protein involved in outer membrane biogenesis
MTKRRRRILVGLGIAGALVAAIGIGAKALLPPWVRGKVEKLATQALGRDLKIAGALELSISLAPRVTAGDVRLANAPWGSEPSMLRVGRVTLVVDLRSLWSGPVRVRDLEIENARLLLEADGDGRGNWVFATGPAPQPPSGPAKRPAVTFEHAAIRGFEMVHRHRPGAEPVTLGVRELEARLDPATRMIDVRGAGQFNGTPWELSGRLGTLERLREGRHVEEALAARIGEARLEIRGRIDEPLVLGKPELDVDVEGPDVAAALQTFGLRSPLTGAFHLQGRLRPAKGGVDVDLIAGVGAVTAKAHGVVDALLSLDAFRFSVEAAGPDASVVGSWVGVRGLPARPFDLSGQVRREDGRLRLEGVKARVGPTSLALTGVLGGPPRLVGTDLTLRAAGKDLSKLSKLAGLRLPPGPFGVAGRILRRADGLAVEGVELQIQGAAIRAGGTLGEPPHLPNLDLSVDASGPDLSAFSRLAHVELPQAPFVLRGRVARDGRALQLHDVEGRLGDDAFGGSGRLALAKRLEGTDVQVRVAGPDLARLASYAGLRGAPAEPFDVKGRVRVVPGGYEVEGMNGSVGRVSAAVEGRIGPSAGLEGTSLSCRAWGPALSDLAAWGLPGNLPADPFSVEGRLRIEEGLLHADGAVANVGPDRASVEGVLGAPPDLSRLEVVVGSAGPSLASLARFLAAAGLQLPRRVPAAPYQISARVRRVPSGYELREARAKAAETVVWVEGLVGTGNGLLGTDLRFGAEAPDTSLLSELAGTPLPNGVFEAHGRLARTDPGLLCDGVAVSVGDAHAEVSGTFGAWPGLAGTELRIDASGSDLSRTLGPVVGAAHLPAAAFELSAELAGSAESLATRRFAARLGGSDLGGSITMRLDGRPTVDASLSSRRLDVAELLAGFGADPAAGAAPAAAAKPPGGKRVFSDQPLKLGALRSVDAALRLEAEAMQIPGVPLRNVVVAGELRDGALRLDRVEGTGANGGRATAGLALEPSGGGYRLAARGRLDGGRLVTSSKGASPQKGPSLDVEFDVKGEGRSLHDIVASLGGAALVVVGPGEVSNAYDRVTTGVLPGLLNALNPFRTSSDHTDFECGVALATAEHGKAAVEPIAVRTDKLTVVGHGRVDFHTEDIDLEWTLKPRKGVGISAGSIANPYIKLGGTLSSPKLEVKPLEAVASTGAAVATLGLTVLAKGFYDRITAEKNECASALKKARGAVPGRH